MSSTLFDLKGKVALVTGATGGLGLAIAQAMADHGASVLASDLDPVLCARLVERIRRSGGVAHDLPADLSKVEGAAALAAAAQAVYGRVDVLVCNAGMQGPAGPIGQASPADWQRVMDLNLRAAVELTTALLPKMAANPGSSVVLMSSIAGLRGNKAIGLYGLSKAALAQLARNLAVEWGPLGVRVNSISPGLIRTPLSASFIDNPAAIERRLSLTPLRRVGEPHEIAGVAVMLASAAGGFITGHNLVVDGGTTISDGN
ncbi:SDR family NAD(P)-dependent oxidoreductase [Acidovorax sp. Root219]|uniref:SDR family NAD(P)-dependent oxidoreductase n=1 Tax=Acidovorax sp. Root219 TaxID=1736493 RepID=UPI00070FA6E2|nr:SDR family oxidoreductase [Acidovorax sp. Root219]KRC29371.1 short-chain dehydrogenase [Acidovorax sp. Root219]